MTDPELTEAEQAAADEAAAEQQAAGEAPDTITRRAVFNTTLQQFVGGVYVGDVPSGAAIKRELEALGMKGHDYEVRAV